MSLFRPGPVPPGVPVERPSWPRFAPGDEFLPPPTIEASSESAGSSAGAEDAEAALSEARFEASQILQEAAAEAEAAVAASRHQGFESGRQDGLASAQSDIELMRKQAVLEVEKALVQAEGLRQTAEAEAKAIRAEAEAKAQVMLAQTREQATRILEDVREEQNRRLDSAQAAVVDLAVAAAVRLVQGHLAIQPGSVVEMVAAGLRRLKETNCTVRVSPQDLPLLEAQRSTLERELGSGLLHLQTDSNLAQGSYLVNSPQGHIDSRVEHQALLLRTALNAALGGSTP